MRPVFAPDHPVFKAQPEEFLRRFADRIAGTLADQAVAKTNRVAYDAEASNLRWFYHTFRSTANYYESCLLRDKLLALAQSRDQSPRRVTEAEEVYAQWHTVLLDERENTLAAMAVMAADMRLDFYYGFAGVVAPGRFHGAEMMRKKLEILETEINQFLPLLAKRCGLTPVPVEGDHR